MLNMSSLGTAPSCSSYMVAFSHRTQSPSGGVCRRLYGNLSICGGNEEAFSRNLCDLEIILPECNIYLHTGGDGKEQNLEHDSLPPPSLERY